MKTVLVTGASGSVGRETVRELLEMNEKFKVRTFDIRTGKTVKILAPYKNNAELFWGDILNSADIEKAVEGVDIVIHLAAVIPPLADINIALAENVNINGTANLIEALKVISPRAKLIYSSSISVYGDRVTNHWISKSDPLVPSVGDYYAHTKIKAEELVRRSGLKWSIFRLTGIMHADMEWDPLMFHMPLDTKLEILTTRDTGYAMAKAADCPMINERIFNLSGGEKCRITFREYINRSMEAAGLGRDVFPETAFATKNFHCGYYSDSEEAENFLHFQRDSIDDLIDEMRKKSGPFKRLLFSIIKPVIRGHLLKQSEPYGAFIKGDRALVNRFYGCFPELDNS